MPYKRPYRTTAADRRRRGPPRRRNATKQVAKVAKKRTGAKAQAKQITTLAHATARIQKQLRDNHNVPVTWKLSLPPTRLVNENVSSQGSIMFFPLTSGPCSDPDSGARSSLISTTATPDMAWRTIQPKQAPVNQPTSTALDLANPTWCKLFRQHVRLAFHYNTLRTPVRYTAMCIRLAREDETTLDNTMLQRLFQIDGATNIGRPDTSSEFARDEDFYSSPGFMNPVGQGNTTLQGVTQPDGHIHVSLNTQRYKMIWKREFTLGPESVNNVGAPSTVPEDVVQSLVPAGASRPGNQTRYETEFSFSYGGTVVRPANTDGPSTLNNPVTLEDLTYTDLKPKLKHWLVLFPSQQLSYPDANPAASNALGVPVMSMDSYISSKCPA